jgi:hypothetical protein
MYTLLQDLKKHFESIENKSIYEKHLLSRIENELQFAPIAFVSRDDIEQLGYNADDITDRELQMVAHKMSDYYLEYGDYNGDLQSAIDECLNLKLREEE